MIRRLAFAVAAVAFSAGAALAQPYSADPDPYALPSGYDQVSGYGEPADAEPAEDYGYQYGDDYGTTPEDEAAPYADEQPDDRGRDDSYYNSGASARGSSAWSREGYSRSGSSYSSRSSATSQEAYIEGEIDERGDARSESYREQSGERSGYAASASSSATASSSARFGYQRRFEAFSVATERSETTSYARREDYAYRRREPRWNAWDIHLDASTQLGLTGGVEGSAPVMTSSGGGYATASASASAYAGARAFAGVRGGRHNGGHGRCGCHR